MILGVKYCQKRIRENSVLMSTECPGQPVYQISLFWDLLVC